MILITVLCIVFGILFVACSLYLFLLKRDIRQLNNKLSDIAHIDTNARLITSTFDKRISDLVQSINDMLKKNRKDHYDARRLEAELKRAITNISHDLRTPLTAARGYLQMLESPDLDAETRARYLEIIGGRLDSLGVLMNNLFEFARIIEGNTTFDIQAVNISNILRDALSEAYGELERKGFTVDVDIPDTPMICLCDTDALRRILQNLLKNVYYHGKEYLSVRLIDNQIEISNKTNNLNKLDVEHIFERFYTADASRTNKSTGLGLAIATELTQRMGGKISVKKDNDMLVFSVQLPSA
ncbi:MAG: HAMP domain-containing histidine kinase [Oscillospiraceae bacterium]|nr:HAMP domain-containing histidine kinase [Oscillospiraceae bacterium]